MKDPSLVATTIAIGGTAGVPVPFPYAANVSAPASAFLTVHGTTADLRSATAGNPVIASSLPVSIDMTRRQIQVEVPHSDWDPTGQVVRLAAGVGLWDKASNRYLLPQQSADATHPGGAGALGPSPAAFFNVAFRSTNQGLPNSEPFPSVQDPTNTAGESAWWRDKAQGDALRGRDISRFYANVDFNKLAAATDDDSAIPRTGPMDRILQSHFETEQGLDFSSTCGSSQWCQGEYRGNLQPYAIYIPKTSSPSGYGMTLLLHSLGANFNQYLGTRNQSQFGDRSPGSIVITPEGRGPDGWYYDVAGADTFEVWADVAAHYKLDPARTVITGYSMGGYGTYKFATQYPDLFAKGQPTVGPPGLGVWVPPAPPAPGGNQSLTFRQLATLRNIPFLIWVEASDELVPFAGTQTQANGFRGLGYEYTFDAFTPGDHLGLAINDQYQPAANFLGDAQVNPNPAHVTYVINPTMNFPKDGTTADHAYWLSALRLSDGSGSAPLGKIDVRSEGFGTGDPAPVPRPPSAGVLTGGNLPALAYNEQRQDLGPTPRTPKADALDINASNVSTVTVNPTRARVDCHARLKVTTDRPLTVNLAGCVRAVRFGVRSLRLSVHPRTAGVGRRTTFTFGVTTPEGHGKRRPVAGALVRFDGASAHTNRHGVARILRTLRSARRYVATAMRGGFRGASAAVRATRPPRFTG